MSSSEFAQLSYSYRSSLLNLSALFSPSFFFYFYSSPFALSLPLFMSSGNKINGKESNREIVVVDVATEASNLTIKRYVRLL